MTFFVIRTGKTEGMAVGLFVMAGTAIATPSPSLFKFMWHAPVMLHTVDSARLDMPVPLQRLQAHIHCVDDMPVPLQRLQAHIHCVERAKP
jgi:hypothetical protein